MNIDQRIDVIEQIGRDRVGQALREFPSRDARKDLMQVGLAMLFRRLAPEDRDRQRIRHRDGGDAPGKSGKIERGQKFADGHQW